MTYETSELWLSAFGTPADHAPHDAFVERMKSSFRSMRYRASEIAQQIAPEQVGLTNHDVKHLDALWHLASKLNDNTNVPLNPAEVFVLGGSILVHDLAHCTAAFGGKEELIARYPEKWVDQIAAFDSNEQEALAALMREVHAEAAEELPNRTWNHPASGKPLQLIEDTDLQADAADHIGRVARSHWLSVEEVAVDVHLNRMVMIGPYSVDLVRIALLLRAADFSHMNSDRAPSFSWALNQGSIAGESLEHWSFQNKTSGPIIELNLLGYNEKSKFTATDRNAWFLAYRLFKTLDAELREIERVSTKHHKPTLLANGVKGVESLLAFSRVIQTSGWEPIEVSMNVSDVYGLFKRLGGEQLYGAGHVWIPLRELIQNAMDATRAARRLDASGVASPSRGVTVRYVESPEPILEITDTGVGMTRSMLAAAITDFGTSYWKSNQQQKDNPGLTGSNFSPTGQYGIGFFAVFMVADKVEVVSRPIAGGSADTHVLHVFSAQADLPYIRKALPGEQLQAGGTVVRVFLRKPLHFNSAGWGEPENINHFLQAEFPTSDINLSIVDSDTHLVVAADDWQSISDDQLMYRLGHWKSGGFRSRYLAVPEFEQVLVEGKVVARLALSPENGVLNGAVVTVGGQRTESTLPYVTGFCVGSSINIAREKAVLTEPAAVVRWTANKIAQEASVDVKRSLLPSQLLYSEGFDVEENPIAVLVTRGGLEVASTNVLREHASKTKSIGIAWLCSEFDSIAWDLDEDIEYPELFALVPQTVQLFGRSHRDTPKELQTLVIDTIQLAWGGEPLPGFRCEHCKSEVSSLSNHRPIDSYPHYHLAGGKKVLDRNMKCWLIRR
jgi:Histidine kinase-, DNA gyrase B-, and HSP90-like ATPase